MSLSFEFSRWFGRAAEATILALCAVSIAAAGDPMLGFDETSTAKQRDLESRFDASLKAENLREWMKRLSARPHHVGSPYDEENAKFLAEQFKSWGYQTEIETFYVLFPTPKERSLKLIEPRHFTAKLEEPALKEDATSDQKKEQVPVYNAYSADGDVTGELVYVNYGVPKDYEELEQRGIDVKGKIVIARYYGSWRGIKPKVAAERGAIGCIIYSDPRDDGYFQGDVYPEGSFRSPLGAQRGSVCDMPLYAGDPLTPGVGATKDAKRLEIKNAPTLTKIPVLPISYADAQPLLEAIGGPVAPEAWRGALPVTYHLGPGPAKVTLKLAFNWDIKPIHNVMAKLPGSERPDEWVIRGNHHDAWVNGANDPISGAVCVMEEARAIGELAKAGWKPKRTIVFALWDGEEPGLLGSTEFVETHQDELTQKACVYVNSDSNGRGFLFAQGSHTLEKFVNQVARDVVDPQKKISVGERLRASRLINGKPEEQKDARDRADLRIGALGSGSDFSPFLQHAGIASLNIGFAGEDAGGDYHSIYDSFDHYVRFGDPTFEYGVALAKTGGRMVMRLADADVLPFEFSASAETIENYIEEVEKLLDSTREETERTNRLIAERRYEAVADPKETFVGPKAKEPVPHINFAPLENAIAKVKESAKAYDEASRAARGTGLSAEAKKQLDETLYKSERALMHAEGLPRRPWYRHHIYAPGFYTGYGVKTLPSIREAIEERNWKEAEEQTALVAKTLEMFAGQIEKATVMLRGAR